MWAVLPLKPLNQVKQRLASLLTLTERQQLMMAMAEDVIRALTVCPEIEDILITSTARYAKSLAENYGLHYFSGEKDTDLNSAVTEAADYLQQQNVSSIIIIHGDIPLLAASDLSTVILKHGHYLSHQSASEVVTFVPDKLFKGTNGLICSPPNIINFSYGQDSLSRYKKQAKEKGIQFQYCPAKSIANDIDQPEDLANVLPQLKNSKPLSMTLSYLETSGLSKKITSVMTMLSINHFQRVYNSQQILETE